MRERERERDALVDVDTGEQGTFEETCTGVMSHPCIEESAAKTQKQ